MSFLLGLSRFDRIRRKSSPDSSPRRR